MKTKILETLNDYYEEYLYYKNKIFKKIKKLKRKIIYCWNNPKNKYLKIVINKINFIYNKTIKYLEKIYQKIGNIYLSVKSYILDKKNRKRNLVALGAIILLNLIILSAFTSYGIYKNEFTFSMMGAKVGYSNQYDYTLLVYVETANINGQGSGTYNLTTDIPTFGYIYSGYKCKNDSTLVFDEETYNTSVTTDHKDICSVYFDLTNTSDIMVQVMLEDSVDSDTYTPANKIPYYGFKYSHYECENNSTLTYNSELHTVKIATETKEYCKIYFQRENADVTVNLFVEANYGIKDYVERLSIPTNNTYILNETNSICYNDNNERVDSSISYTDGYVEISGNEVSYCDVYLDLENE